MIANYHTHTPRCRHASGTEEEYVLAALDSGMEILGFSDHTPYFFPDDHPSPRMFPHQLQDYTDTIRALQKAYRGHLQIHLGLEAEFYPAYFPELLLQLRDQGIEYLLLGQHWPGNEIGEQSNFVPTEDEHRLQRYCDQVIEAMHTGYFTYLAHPDMFNFVGDDKIYETHMRRLCRAAKECSVPLEINLLGLRTGRHYPNMRFWRLAAEENCDTVMGCDAHDPEALKHKDSEARAMEIVQKYGLTLLHTLPLRKI